MPERTLNEADTLALVAQVRELCAKLARHWAVSEIELHRLLRCFAQPELSAPARSYHFKVEQWDKTEDHIIWLIAVSNNFLVARAAYEAAVKYNPRNAGCFGTGFEWWSDTSHSLGVGLRCCRNP